MTILRYRPLMAVLLALIALLALSGAAYAIGRSFGYFPGLGVVEQGSPFYVLAAPVSQTRDGITITVQQAIINMDQLSVTFTVENIPADKYSVLILPDSKMCMSNPELHFSNGKTLKSYSGTTDLLASGYEGQYKFTSVPWNTVDATLHIPCIQGASDPGILPENWEVPMRFAPALPQFAITAIPMTEISLSQNAAEPVPAAEITPISMPDPTLDNRLSILQVIDTGDGYILIGAFTPPAPPAKEKGFYAVEDHLLTDGNGQTVDWQPVVDVDLTPYIIANRDKDIWALKVMKNFAPPLHITYRTRYIYTPLPQDVYTFEFDAGPNPQAGQEWIFNQEFQLAGRLITLTRIAAGVNSLTFFFNTDDESVESLGMHSLDDIQIEGYTPIDFGGSFGVGSWSLTKTYPEIPKGKLRVILSGLYLYGEVQDWSIDWQP